MSKGKFLRPGSDEAIDAGCTCPVLDNGHGRGYFGRRGVYVMRGDCPLHGKEAKKALDVDVVNYAIILDAVRQERTERSAG